MKSLLIAGFLAATTLGGYAEVATEPNEKAARYHKLLLKRPDSGTLFERFVDSWLDTGSKEDLETFLKEGAQNGGAQEWRLLATYQDWMGREEQALEAMSSALEKEPESGALFFARAKLKARLLDFEGALADLEKSQDEAGEEAATLKGTWLARAGRPEEALAAWQELLAARPDDEELREDLIELQVGEGLYDEAIATARKLAEDSKDPYQKALRWMRVAGVEVMAGKQDEGLATYQRVLEMTGEDSWLEKEVLAQVDKVFRREENIAGLRDFYAALREKFPQRVSLRKGLAAQMAANGETDEAISLFREVLKITPGDVANRQQFIALLETSERFDLAVEELEVILRENGEQPEGWERMARLRDLMGDAKGLEEALDKVRELRAVDGPGIVATSSLYERYKMREKAEEILRQGHADFPEANEVAEALASFLADIDADEDSQAEATEMWLAMAEGADAEGLLRVARALLANRRAEACFTLLSERITENPENILLLKQLCDAGLAADKAQEALPYALKMAELAQSPTDLASALTEVTRLSRRLDLDPILADLMSRENKSAKHWCIIAELNEQQGDLIASDEALAEATKIEQGPLILSQKVRLLESREELEKAAAVMREIIALPGGERPVYLRKLVGLLASAGNWEDALAATDDWKRIAPGDKGAWLRRSELLNESGELEESVNELRRALAKFGDEEEIKGLLATALVEAGEYTEGERLYRKLYEEAEDANAKNRWIEQLAALAQQENRVDELLNEFERRKRRNSQEAGPLQALAKIHEKLGDYEMQREALAEAVRRKPANVKLRQDLARVEEQAGDIDRATATLREAARLDSGPLSRQKLVEFYFRIGEIELGLDVLRGIQNGDPREVEKTTLALMQNGEWETAASFLAESATKDWRLTFLTGLNLYLMDEKDAARDVLRQLTSVNTEIEGLKPQIDDKTLERWRGWMRHQGADKDPREILLVKIMAQQVNGLMQLGTQNSGYNYRGRRNTSQTQMLPGTSEEMRALSLAFLTNDAHQQTGEQRDELLAAIQFPEGILGEQMKNRHRIKDWVEEALAAGSMDLADAVMMASNSKDFDIKHLEQAATELKESNPDAADAALSALLYRESDLSKSEIIAQKLALLDHFEASERENRLNGLTALVFTPVRDPYQYYGGYGGQQTITTDEATKNLLRATLLAELENTPIAAKLKDGETALAMRTWFTNLITDAWQNGRAKDFVTLTNRMVEEYAVFSKDQKSMVFYNGRYYPASAFSGRNQQQALLQPPTFPRVQRDLPMFLQTLLSSPFASADDKQESGNAFVAQWRRARDARVAEQSKDEQGNSKASEAMTPDTLAPELANIDSSRLRLLAYYWSGNTEKLEEELAEFANSQDAQEVLAAAGYWFQKEDLLKSYQLLAKARFLPMEKDERKAVDGELTVAGASLAQKGTELTDLEVAQRAVLRIRRSARTPEDQELLAGPMTSLGLSDIVAQMQTARLRRGALANNRNRSSSRGTSPRLTKALGDGNKEAAAREALRLLRPLLRTPHQQWQLERLTEQLVAGNITDEILALANPHETKSYSRRMEFVSLCGAFKKPELALPYLKELSKERPKDDQVTAKLARYLPQEEMKVKAQELMTAEALEDFGTLAVQLANSRTNDRFGGDSRAETKEEAELNLASYTLTTEFLQKVGPEPSVKRNLSWYLALVAGGAMDAWSFDDEETPSLLEYPSEPSDFHKERVKITRELLLAGLRHPQIAKQAFAVMDGYQKGLQFTDEELLEAAFTAAEATNMKAEEEENLNNYQNYRPQSPWRILVGTSSTSREPRSLGKDPSDYLTLAMAQQDEETAGELSARFDEIAPEESKILALARVFSSQSDEEAETALADWRKALDSDRKTKLAQYLSFLTVAVYNKAPAERVAKLEQEFFRILIKELRYDDVADRAMAALAQAHFEAGGTNAMQVHLDRVLNELIGPPELWEQWVKLTESNQTRDQEVNAVVHVIYNQAQKLLKSSRDVDQVLTIAKFKPFLHNNDYEISRSLKAILFSNSPEEGEKVLKEINFWNRSWAELGQILDEDDKKCTWNLVLENLVSYDDRKELRKKWGNATGNRRFRNRLAAAYYGEKKNQIPGELEGVAGGMLKMAPEEQTGIANILNTLYPSLNVPDPKPKTKELLTLLGQEEQGDLIAGAKEKIEKGFEGQIHDYRGRRQINSDTLKLIPYDSQLAAEYFAAATKEPKAQRQVPFGQSVRMNSNNSGINEQDEYFEDLLDSADRSASPVTLIDWSRFQRAYETLPDAPLLSVGHAERYDISELLSKFWSSQTKPEDLEGVEAEIFKQYHWNDLPKNFEKEEPAVRKVAVWLTWLGSSRTWNVGEQAQKHWDWMEDSNYAERHPLLFARNSTITALRGWDELKPEAYPVARKYFAEALADPEMTVRFRMEIACAGLNQEPRIADSPEGVAAITELIESYLAEKRALTAGPFGRFLIGVNQLTTPLPRERWNKVLDQGSKTLLSLAANQNYNRHDTERLQFAQGLVELSIKLENPKVTKSLLDISKETLRGNLDLMLELVTREQPALAKLLVTTPGLTYKIPPNTKWNPELAKTVEKLLPLITNSQERYRIHCLLASLADENDEVKPSQKERLIALAGEFSEEAPKVPQAQLQTLRTFLQTREAVAILLPELEVINQRYLYTQAMEQDRMPGDLSADNLRFVLDKYGLEMARRGNLQPMDRHFKALAASILTDQNSYYAERSSSGFYWNLFTAYIQGRSEDPETAVTDETLALAKDWYLSLGKAKVDYPSVKVRAVAFPFILHVLAGKGQEFADWVATLPEEDQAAYLEQLKSPKTLLYTWTDNNWWKNKERDAIGRYFAQKLIDDQFGSQTLMGKHLASYRIPAKKVLSVEDYEKIYANLPPEHPQAAQFKLDVGIYIARHREKEREKAFTMIQEALEQLATTDKTLEAFGRAELAAVYGDKMKDYPTAIELAKDVDWDQIPEKEGASLRKRLKAYPGLLKKQLENKKKDKKNPAKKTAEEPLEEVEEQTAEGASAGASVGASVGISIGAAGGATGMVEEQPAEEVGEAEEAVVAEAGEDPAPSAEEESPETPEEQPTQKTEENPVEKAEEQPVEKAQEPIDEEKEAALIKEAIKIHVEKIAEQPAK